MMQNKKSAARTGIRKTQKNQHDIIISNLFNPVKLHNALCYAFFILNIVMMIMAVSLIELGHSVGSYFLAAILAMISLFNIICFAVVNDDGGDYRE